MAVSVFDIFKIGIGPSSSHTVGPMRAARLFADPLPHQGLLASCARVEVKLYGSLGSTGKRPRSDKAVLRGLEGPDPERSDVEAIGALLERIRSTGQLGLAGLQPMAFNEKTHLAFFRRETLSFHPNGMRC